MIIDLQKFSIIPNSGEDMTANFNKLFMHIANIDGAKEVILPKGRYDLFCDNAVSKVTYISNTLAKKEVKIPNRLIAMYLKGIRDFTLDGNGSVIVIHGKSSNMFIEESERVRIKNLTIEREIPAVSQIEVVKVNCKSAVIKIHPDCKYVIEKGQLKFITDNSEYNPHKSKNVWWYGVSGDHDTKIINRTAVNPFRYAKAAEIEPNLIKLSYTFCSLGVKEGRIYHIHTRNREEVGIFCGDCKDIVFDSVHERSNYSHAFIFQCCDTITLNNVSSAPEEGSGRIAASQTDCVHCSMCKGSIKIENSLFKGAFDDVLNVHGFHFKIVDKKEDWITVKFMHAQSYGFKPFDVGDKIITVDAATLIGGKEYVIKRVEMLDLYKIRLDLEGDISDIKKGKFIENITKCADVIFSNNYCTKIPTRGVLVTTRGKVVIENNTFDNMQMSGVLISDDAKSWYESGAARDVTIRNNKFIKCKDSSICIKPENRVFADHVHSGINICGNEFIYDTLQAIYAKDSKDITVSDNTFIPLLSKSEPMVFVNCANVVQKDNKVNARSDFN